MQTGSYEFKFVCSLMGLTVGRNPQVYKLSIAAACALSWPSDRIIIQVLDDSTDPTVKVLLLFVTVL